MHSHTQKKENWLCSFPTVILHIHKAEIITLQSSTCSHLTLEDSHTHSLNHSHTYTLTNSNTHGHTLTRTRANILTNFETLKHTHKDFLSIKQSQSHILSHTHTHSYSRLIPSHTLTYFLSLLHILAHTLRHILIRFPLMSCWRWTCLKWADLRFGLFLFEVSDLLFSSCTPQAQNNHSTRERSGPSGSNPRTFRNYWTSITVLTQTGPGGVNSVK